MLQQQNGVKGQAEIIIDADQDADKKDSSKVNEKLKEQYNPVHQTDRYGYLDRQVAADESAEL